MPSDVFYLLLIMVAALILGFGIVIGTTAAIVTGSLVLFLALLVAYFLAGRGTLPPGGSP